MPNVSAEFFIFTFTFVDDIFSAALAVIKVTGRSVANKCLAFIT